MTRSLPLGSLTAPPAAARRRDLPAALLALATAFALAAAVLLPVRPAAATTGAGELTLTGPAGVVTYDQAVALHGALAGDTGGTPVALERRTATGWVGVGAPQATDSAGTVTFTSPARYTATFRLVADPAGAATPSNEVDVQVRSALSAHWAGDGVRTGRTITLRGTLRPANGGVRLERGSHGRWHAVAWARAAADGAFRFRVRGGAPSYLSYRVVRAANNARLGATVYPGRLDVYRLHTYVVRTRGKVYANVAAFARSAQATYDDPRGWRRGHHRFRRVRTGGDFTLVLSQARYLPAFSPVCSSMYSCRAGRYVVINDTRWRRSSPHFTGDLATYRQYLVDHETGHWLGRPHAYCSGPGRLAPVMQQQSKGMQGCRPNAWPLAREVAAVS